MLRLKLISMVLLYLFSINIWGNDIIQDNFDMQKECLARNIYFEAGNQPLAGQIAVALVTINRVKNSQFPNTICEVIYQAKLRKNARGEDVPIIGQCQFSWFCDGKSDRPVDSDTWLEALGIAYNLFDVNVIDITEGALWYHADYTLPYWTNQLNQTVTIENHIFYR